MGSNAWLTGALVARSAAMEALGLQDYVVHEAWIGQSGDGDPIYDTPVQRKAVIQEGSSPHRRLSIGEVVTARAAIFFLDPIERNGAPGRHEPIDPRDQITIRYGQEDAITGPILEIPGAIINPSTGTPFTNAVWLK